MAKRQQEKFKTYVVPSNFIDKMRIAGGLLKLRNLVEAALIAGLFLVPVLVLVPMSLTGKLYFTILVGIPLFALGCMGMNGDSLFQFLGYWLAFKRNKRISRYNPHIKKPDNIRESLNKGEEDILPRDKILKKLSELTGRSFEVEDQNYDDLYEDVSMQVRFDDDNTVLSYGFETDESLSKKDRQKQEKRARQLAALGVSNMGDLHFDKNRKEFVDAPQETSPDEIADINRFIEEAKAVSGEKQDMTYAERIKNLDVASMIMDAEKAEEAAMEIPVFDIFGQGKEE